MSERRQGIALTRAEYLPVMACLPDLLSTIHGSGGYWNSTRFSEKEKGIFRRPQFWISISNFLYQILKALQILCVCSVHVGSNYWKELSLWLTPLSRVSSISCLLASHPAYAYLAFSALLNFDRLCIGTWVCLLLVDGGGGNKDGDLHSRFRYGGDNDSDKSKGAAKARTTYWSINSGPWVSPSRQY